MGDDRFNIILGELRVTHTDSAALQTMEGYAVSPGDAEQFAAQGPLQAQSVEYPKEPQ